MFLNQRKYWFYVLLCVLCAACSTVDPDGPQQVEELSPEQKEEADIDFLIDAMAIPGSLRADVICKKLIEEHGEKALPKLAENIENRLPIVRLLCIFCVGKIYEKTKSPMALELKPKLVRRLTDTDERVRFEAAGSLCSFQDYQGVSFLIDALRNDSPFVRMVAYELLFRNFQLTFNYRHNDEESQREVAAKQWESWWVQNKEKYLAAEKK